MGHHYLKTVCGESSSGTRREFTRVQGDHEIDEQAGLDAVTTQYD